ncbi:unnamed protein product [Effrenium voratum]|nr:unnamed protein product [Effrenium voratum]
MGSGASAAGEATLPWPAGYRVALYPGATLPGIQIGAPAACSEKGVGFWRLGGPGKARLRVLEDPNGLLELTESFTVGVCFRAGDGSTAGWDSILLGHDNKHWLVVPGDDKAKLCCLNADEINELPADFLHQGWVQVFLRSTEGGTSVLAVDAEGLLDLGTFPTSLVGSKLRSAGWASNELDVAAIALWDRCLSWGELQTAISPPPVPAAHSEPTREKKILGQVTDLKGNPLSNVNIKWKATGCLSDEEGHFQLEDDETDVPETASQTSGKSGSSTWSCLSFQCEGFAPTMVPASDESVQVVLRPLSASATLDATAGGSVEDPVTGSSVTVPGNALCYADGRPCTGPVTVSLSVIDVTDPQSLASMPGDFTAIADGQEVMLESLGAAWINATDDKGEELEVREGSEVVLDLHTQAKANCEKLGVTPEMWSFDAETGKWKLEAADMAVDGVPAANSTRKTAREVATTDATVRSRGRKKKMARGVESYDPEHVSDSWITPEKFMAILAQEGTKSLAAPVQKFGYWNVDMLYNSPNKAVLLQGLVVDASKKPLPGLQIWGEGKDYHGRSPDRTAADGRFGALMVQFDSKVDVHVQYSKPANTDQKIDVYYSGGKLPSCEPFAISALKQVPGRYCKSAKEMKWTNVALGSSSIEWDERRRRWNHVVSGSVLFCLPSESAESTPAAEGWQATPQACTRLAPNYRRSLLVTTETFGPFSTGPPGNFVDIGELSLST